MAGDGGREPLEVVHRARDAARETFAREVLRRARGLDARLLLVHEANTFTGFLPQAADIRLCRLEEGERRILVVLNPRRRDPRASHPLPPLEARAICPLCDLPFSQLPLPLELAGSRFIAAPSPAPYLPVPQCTLADARHRPQEPAGPEDFRELVAAMIALLREAPQWIAGYNGVAAGASVVEHRHFHALRTDGEVDLPGLRPEATRRGLVDIRGSEASVLEGVCAAFRRWRASCGAEATENLVLMREAAEWRALFVPRERRREQLAGLPEVRAGFMEAALATVILKRPRTIEAFEAGTLDFAFFARALDSIRPAVSLT